MGRGEVMERKGMATRRRALLGVGALAGLSLVGPALAQSVAPLFAPLPPARPVVVEPPKPVRVYLFRGLFELFSLGLDDLRGKFRREGHWSEVYSLAQTQGVLADILTRHATAPNSDHLVFIGHSWGGDTALAIADALYARGGAVDLVVAFDAVTERRVGPGVRRFVNFYQSQGGWSKPVEPARGFSGEIENRDLAFALNRNHLNIERSPDLHADILSRVAAIAGPTSTASVRARRG